MLLDHLGSLVPPVRFPVCPVCQSGNWSIGGLVAPPVVELAVEVSGIVPTEASISSIQIVCTNCFYIMNFAAGPMRVRLGR